MVRQRLSSPPLLNIYLSPLAYHVEARDSHEYLFDQTCCRLVRAGLVDKLARMSLPGNV